MTEPAPKPSLRFRRFAIPVLLAAIVLLGLGLRLGGLDWGVPKEPHYRNYFQDERFALGLLFKMNPARLNFDPGYFINPSLHYYNLLFVLGAADVFGLGLKLPVKDASPLKPADVPGRTYTGMFVVTRLLVILQGALAVLLMFFIGRSLYNPLVGLFASLLFAVSYPCMYQSHFITADAPAVFWLVLSLFFLARLFREPGRKAWQVLAPLSIGLALGTKYLNLLLVLPWLYILYTSERKAKSRKFLRRALPGLLLAGAAFLFTTPYALLSFNTFLNGDKNGFGGIFGERGLMFYNNFPPSLVEPFAVTSLAALNIIGLVAFLLSLVVLFRRRKPQDMLLLTFIAPFYLMLMLKSSPMLRHILPVLPFVFLACAAALAEPKFLRLRTGVMGRVLLGIVALSWFGLSLAGVERMSRTDTRIQAEAWAEANVTTETIALPTYFPYRYTPALDSFKLLPLNYDYRILDRQRPEYLLVTEPEIMVNGRSDDRADIKQMFMSAVQANQDYVRVKRLAEPFRLFGVNFDPKFPTEDWSFPSPEILIYRRQAGPVPQSP